MTLEDFKDVYKDKTPVEKLKLMQVQHNYWRNDMKDRVDANWRGNFEEAQYYARECDAMRDRIIWLHEEISKALGRLEPIEPIVDVDEWKCRNCGHSLEHQQLLGDNVLFHEQYRFCPECGQAVKWE